MDQTRIDAIEQFIAGQEAKGSGRLAAPSTGRLAGRTTTCSAT